MKKLATLAVIGVLAAGTPAFATTHDSVDAAVDAHSNSAAIAKDHNANMKDHTRLKSHQAAKAHAKATGDTATQAEESVKIGADRAAIGEKNAETSADQSIKENSAD